jgi:hypothetical protein
MLALLVEDVTLLKQRQIIAGVRFRGGATTTLTLPRPLTAQRLRATHDDVRRERGKADRSWGASGCGGCRRRSAR